MAQARGKRPAGRESPPGGCGRARTGGQNRKAVAERDKRGPQAAKDPRGFGYGNVLVVKGVKQAEAEYRPWAKRGHCLPEMLCEQRLELMAGVDAREVYGVEQLPKIPLVGASRVREEKGVKRVGTVHQHHGLAAVEVLETEELTQREDACVAGEQNQTVQRLVERDRQVGSGQTGYGHATPPGAPP